MGQISPPGMDDTNVVAWGAIGINQQIGKKWAVTVYGGAARESNPNNTNLLQKQAIVVFNQETQYQFNSHWLLSFCSSFRIQDRYKEDAPSELQNPPLRDEARLYLRLYYKHSLRKIGMTYSFRPEYRAFYDTHWNHWDGTPFELRFRLKAQANIPLNASKTNQFILANEFLSATDDQRNANHELHWSAYRFTEDRFTTYLRHVFTKQSIIADIGMMHQIKYDKGKSDYIAQFAFDILFQNPFWKPKNGGH
jgi:hypothetical protein